MENKKSSQDKTVTFQKGDVQSKNEPATLPKSYNSDIWKTMSVEVEGSTVHITRAMKAFAGHSIFRITTYNGTEAIGVSSFLVPGATVKEGKHAQTGENIVTLAMGR